MQGNLENENLLVLLQTLGRELATGALSIVNPEHGEARVYFKDGRIVYAHRGSLHDHRLVLSILQDPRGSFQFVERATPSVQTIVQTLDNFLLEVGRLRFAFGAGDLSDAQDMLDPNQVPRVLNPARLREMRFAADDNWLVLHLDGAHTVAQLIAIERREGQASALLKRLQNLGMVELPIPPVTGRRSSSPAPTLNLAQVPRVLDAERLTQMQFSIDEFHIIMNLDGQRSLRELAGFERTPGQLPALISHLEAMNLLELSAPQTSAPLETVTTAQPATETGVPSNSVSTTVSTSVNVDALPELDPKAIPVILDDVKIKETRFSADDNWLVIHFDGRNIEALSKLEKRRGQLKMLMYRLTGKNLVELRPPSSVSFSPATTTQTLSTPQIPILFESGRASPLSFSADELALVLQIDGEKTIRDLRRFEGREGQLERLIERLELEGVLELREAPLKLKAGISSDLTGMSMAVDQSVLESWERRLGRQVWRARVHLPSGLEHSCELMASTGADTFVLLSQDVVKGGGVKNGTGVKVYAE